MYVTTVIFSLEQRTNTVVIKGNYNFSKINFVPFLSTCLEISTFPWQSCLASKMRRNLANIGTRPSTSADCLTSRTFEVTREAR